MSEINTTNSVEIKNYTVPVRYFTRAILKGGKVVEKEVAEEVEIGMLARTSASHTKFATEFMKVGAGNDIEADAKIAVKFASLMIVDDKKREAIVKDEMACLDIFLSEPVQKDIERFLSTWGIVQRMTSNAPEEDKSQSLSE